MKNEVVGMYIYKINLMLTVMSRYIHELMGGGGEFTYFLGGYVCQMTQNCDP